MYPWLLLEVPCSWPRFGSYTEASSLLVALFAVLMGLQLLQMASATAGVTSIGFLAGGTVVIGSSLYLIYILHWE